MSLLHIFNIMSSYFTEKIIYEEPYACILIKIAIDDIIFFLFPVINATQKKGWRVKQLLSCI